MFFGCTLNFLQVDTFKQSCQPQYSWDFNNEGELVLYSDPQSNAQFSIIKMPTICGVNNGIGSNL